MAGGAPARVGQARVGAPTQPHLRPSEIDKKSRRMAFPGFGPALDKEFVKGESIPEKRLDKSFLTERAFR